MQPATAPSSGRQAVISVGSQVLQPSRDTSTSPSATRHRPVSYRSMKKKILLISSANPYPIVTNGCARLLLDYQRTVFAGYDVHFVATKPGTWAPLAWFHGPARQGQFSVERLLELDFAFAFFVGFGSSDFSKQVMVRVPSFCLTDTHPHPDLPEGVFKGILTHRATVLRDDILLCGGTYDCEVFYKQRTGDEFIVSVGRIHHDKNQLELVSDYRNRIYNRYGLPLYLVGGVDDRGYYQKVRPYIDRISVHSTIDESDPHALDSWRSPLQIAALLNCARFFVTASPKESFGIAVAEALACGTTCVLNGEFRGFNPADLRPYVFGNITCKRSSILDVLEEALATGARLDGSEWVKKYSVRHAAHQQMEFIEKRLREP
jgi:glycosyltransferase involved in cell wall biosynthesis